MNPVDPEVVDEEPIRLSFGGKRKVTTDEVKALKVDQQVSSIDGRAYDGKAHGQLTLQGGSERVQRRQQGLSSRQWKKLRKAARRG